MKQKDTKGIINIHGKEHYFVDSEGSVYTNLAQGTRGKKTVDTPFALSPVKNEAGYLQVNLGRGCIKYIHVLVLESFMGARPKGADACHKNGIKTDNRLENLYWGSRKENVEDSRKHGTMPLGEKRYNAKLRREDVEWLRQAKRSNPLFIKTMAMRFGVAESTIRDVLKERTWNHGK